MSQPAAQAERRTVRSKDVTAADMSAVANGIEDLYNDVLDVIVVRGAIDAAGLARAGAELDEGDPRTAWARPNAKMPVEDIQILGSDTPATPTFQAPRGASLDEYLAAASGHAAATAAVFDRGLDATGEFKRVLGSMAGGRPANVAVAVDGRTYTPFTIRRLTDGKQIGVHHDYHYPLDLYTDLAPRVDTRTLVSFVATLRRPEAGGELFVYGVTPTTPDAPRMPNGYQWDLDAIEQRYDCAKFEMQPGDLFLLASGRCLHRVGKVAGPHARVTMGGFLALDKEGREVLFWS